MGRRLRSTNLLSNLPQLQNLIKRDPQSYVEEFNQQLHHFEASLAIFELKPDEESKEFGELINFLSQVARCYPKKSAQFPAQLIALLERHYPVLDAELRKTIVQALILLRSRGLVSNVQVMPLFFTLFRCRDKKLRKLLYTHIVSDVKAANRGRHRDEALNKALQNFMYTMITAADAQDKRGEGAIAAKKSLDVCIDLYRKGIWTDAKAVNVVVQACYSPITKIMVTAVQFFLNPLKKSDGDDDSDDSGTEAAGGSASKKAPGNFKMIRHQSNVNKKTKHRKRILEKVTRAHKLELAKRNGHVPDGGDSDDGDGAAGAGGKKKKKRGGGGPAVRFDALSLVHDPQGFAEKLFARVHRSATATKRGGSTGDRFEVRLMLLKLISRLIGHHQLQLMALYPFLQRYLQPHQVDVTQILALLANASHAFTPPDALQPLIRAVADNFVSDHCSPEVMSAGLNTIRAIAVRQPLALDPDLLNDLVLYRKHKDKGVTMAARSLLLLYRQANPELLRPRDRGRDATQLLKAGGTGSAPLAFGEPRPAEGIDGAEFLAMSSDDDDDDNDDEADDASDAPLDGQSDAGTDGDESDISSDDDAADDCSDEIDIDAAGESDLDSDLESAVAESDEESDAESDSGESDAGSAAEGAENHSGDEASAQTLAPVEPAEAKQPAVKKRIEMTRFLTNEDFARIERLKKRQRAGGALAQRKKRKAGDPAPGVEGEAEAADELDDGDDSDGSSTGSDSDGLVKDWDILGDYHSRRRSRKATYEERMQSIRAGREGREKFASSKAKRDKESRGLSNKEKRKTKDFKMIAHKRSIVSKSKRSLTQKRRELRKHIIKQKKKGF
ncbi:Severe Depolymerization of Actin [Coemansia biformis]|uniref:Protein SDA1 n=1 Tax=Coemansia biformis TaxID=1286918 RepID=A0A9W8D1K9_9FUNG|nr:Severe Depolymerization of Actin [Coemansia biformis]